MRFAIAVSFLEGAFDLEVLPAGTGEWRLRLATLGEMLGAVKALAPNATWEALPFPDEPSWDDLQRDKPLTTAEIMEQLRRYQYTSEPIWLVVSDARVEEMQSRINAIRGDRRGGQLRSASAVRDTGVRSYPSSSVRRPDTPRSLATRSR